MKKKIHKLSVNIHSEFHVLGIASHENDYRLSWAINSQLNLNLSKSEELHIISDKVNEEQEFSVFSYTDEEGFHKYNLISNRCHDGFLLPKHKNVDFFMLIHGEFAEYELNILLSKLQQIDIITLAFKMADLSPKSKEKLIF